MGMRWWLAMTFVLIAALTAVIVATVSSRHADEAHETVVLGRHAGLAASGRADASTITRSARRQPPFASHMSSSAAAAKIVADPGNSTRSSPSPPRTAGNPCSAR